MPAARPSAATRGVNFAFIIPPERSPFSIHRRHAGKSHQARLWGKTPRAEASACAGTPYLARPCSERRGPCFGSGRVRFGKIGHAGQLTIANAGGQRLHGSRSGKALAPDQHDPTVRYGVFEGAVTQQAPFR